MFHVWKSYSKIEYKAYINNLEYVMNLSSFEIFFLKKYKGNIIMGITISIPGVIFKLVPIKPFVSFQRNFSPLSAPDLSLWKFGHLTTFDQKNFSNLNKESYGNKYVRSAILECFFQQCSKQFLS